MFDIDFEDIQVNITQLSNSENITNKDIIDSLNTTLIN